MVRTSAKSRLTSPRFVDDFRNAWRPRRAGHHLTPQKLLATTHCGQAPDQFRWALRSASQRALQFVNARLCSPLALLHFKAERFGHNGHHENTHLLGQLSHHGCCACAGTTAHSRGDEQHIGTANGTCSAIFDSIAASRPTSGFGASAQTLRQLGPERIQLRSRVAIQHPRRCWQR